MVDYIVRFSRLLRIFKLNDYPAFIIELEESDQKTLYISYFNENEYSRNFESYEKTKLKEEFKDLSAHCLMSQCTNATGMFEFSPITHFGADCSNVVNGEAMFRYSHIRFINACFSKLKDAKFMFSGSLLEKITTQFPLLENGKYMFKYTPLKEINCHFPKIKRNDGMFDNTPEELRQNYPHYFI